MSELNIAPLQGWRITGQLYDTEHPELLNQDMLELEHLETGLLIHIGWSPEGSVSGHYEIRILRGCEMVLGPAFISDMALVAAVAEMLARRYSQAISETVYFDVEEQHERPTPVRNRALSSPARTRELTFA